MDKYQNKVQTQLPRLSSHPRFGPMSATAKILLMVILHIVLALAMRSFTIFSTLHALIVFAIGAYIALTSKDIKAAIPIVGYITGAEVLWRMTRAGVFWEFGKYATIAILMLALLKKGKLKKSVLPLLFFIVLIPSVIFTIDAFGFSERARELISFNLSGPLAASICILFFSHVETNLEEIKTWIWLTVYPILGILTLAAYSTITATEIDFGSESVFVTSGGYGPNQVSAVLGLGAILLVMLAISEGKKIGRFWAILFALGLLVQSFLTFSRGGIYNFTISLGGAILHLLGKPNKFTKGIFILIVFLALMVVFIIPQLETFTGGMLSQRFLDTDLTSRESLFEADFKIFLENPVFGVGPGMAMYFRRGATYAAAHTEYSRILAEHGIGGALALLILAFLLVRSYFKAPDALTRAWVVALAGWPLVEMAHAAMRVVAISFMLGLAMVNWGKAEDKTTNEETFFLSKPIKRKF